jgi:hypothetical protein
VTEYDILVFVFERKSQSGSLFHGQKATVMNGLDNKISRSMMRSDLSA